ncbi:MAG: hypothetical protein L0209_06125 [candidate division Zixibacteria bacterium]|nr:hypothetical protein [candidate division Zixibacteria bacterium]
MKRFTILFGVGMFLILAASAFGAVPQLINFQGVLKDAAGNPPAVDMLDVTFTIYDDPLGGTALWTETQPITIADEGRFNVLLGSSNPIPDSVFKDTVRYLGIKVDTDPEMIPRQRLVSVGYAYRVGTIDGAAGGTINGAIDAPGMSSKIRFHFNDFSEFPAPTTYHGMFAHAHNQGAAYYAHAAQWVRLADSAHPHSSLAASDLDPNPALSVDADGNIGIGTTTPSAKLGVLNSVSSAASQQGVSGIVSNSSTGSAFGGIFTASSAGTGIKSGVRGNASSTSGNPAYGVYGDADNGSSGEAYGGFFNVSTGGTGTGPHYGVWGSSFGVSGPVYGGYFFTDTTGTGTKYGVYATAPTAEGYAGNFSGNVRVTDTLFASNVSSLSPLRLQTGGTTRMYIDDVAGRGVGEGDG